MSGPAATSRNRVRIAPSDSLVGIVGVIVVVHVVQSIVVKVGIILRERREGCEAIRAGDGCKCQRMFRRGRKR